ncbi:MAG: hypothetical protein ACOH2A_05525 [Sphingobacteriaceae bacterium]
MQTERNCLDCGETLRGRLDKKFCNDACRNSYNNQRNSDSHNMVRNINNILRRNRRILEALNPEGKTKVTLKKLATQAFHLDYFTHIYQTQTGKTYRFCYDQGYLLLANEEVLLVKKEGFGK